MYKYLFAAIALTASAGAAQAVSRYDPANLTCAKAQSIIASEGAAIMTHQTGTVTGNRYVENGQTCPAAEFAMRKYITTSDLKNCPVLACAKTIGDHSFHDLEHMQPLMR